MSASAAAAVILHKEKVTVQAFRNAGAVSPDRAVSLDEIGATEGIAFRRLIDRAVLREVETGRYYLDEPSWAAVRRMRIRLVGLILVVLLALMLLGVVSIRSS